MRGGAAPHPLHSSPCMGAPPHAPGDFLFEKKVTKDSPGGHPGPPEGGTLSPLRRCRTPQIGLSATKKDRFATLSCGQIGLCFFLKLYRGSHLLLSIRGAAGALASRMLEGLSTTTNTARAGGRGIKGGEAPFAGGPGTRRFLVSLCLLSSREKVGRGAGRSARISGDAGAASPA